MRCTGLSWIPAATLAIVLSGCSKTENTTPRKAEEPGARAGAVGTGGAGADVKSDADFVRDVAMKAMAEIELSRLAAERATAPAIKAFAQRTIDERSASLSALKGIAAGQPIEWPAKADDADGEIAAELARKQGTEFDRGYLEAMVEGHQNLAAKLESRLDVQSLADWKTAVAGRTQGKTMPDPAVSLTDVRIRPDKSAHEMTGRINQWAADTYPVTQKHLDTARSLENSTTRSSR